MANTKSLYELKMDEKKKKNSNMVTDSDYYLRDKSDEKDALNVIDMTPVAKAKPRAKAEA